MEQKHYPYPSIVRFKDVIRKVKETHDYKGKDENGDPIFLKDTPYPILKFRGRIKIHGCFDKDTLVTLSNGESIKISKLKVGTSILSYDFDKNEICNSIVTETYQKNLDKE